MANPSIRVNLSALLEDLTGAESWKEFEGPNSGSGVDYWFRNDAGHTVLVNLDEESLSIVVDETIVFRGSILEEPCSRYVKTSLGRFVAP
jgi:hypothetical protein